MCGIVGFTGTLPAEQREQALVAMRDRLTHRGPDGAGTWLDARVALGHRRLSVIDIEGGRQPMATPDGRMVLVFNGEIYNFAALRRELAKQCDFKTDSDTEVLLQAWRRWGPDCLARLNGMFAFALYDTERQRLFLARDRMGQKPLCYARTADGELVFASESRALFAHPGLTRAIDPQALDAYLRFDYIPAPASIFAGVSKLGGGQWLSFDLNTRTLRIETWWQRRWEGIDGPEPELAQRFRELLGDAVAHQMVADVPLGIFLSGGIDSSAVAAMACRHCPPEQVRTFSIAFAERSFDESDYALQVARHLGTRHQCRTLAPEDLLDALPQILPALDEPFADPSLVPTWLLSRFAREQVTVALGGDGADELFAGYPTFWAHALTPGLRLPAWLARGCERALDLLPVCDDNLSLDYKLRQFVRGLPYRDWERVATWQGSLTDAECAQLLGTRRTPWRFDNYANLYDFYQQAYLQEDIHLKVDRASMLHSLEVRAPFMDVPLVEFANNLHPRWKRRGTTGKVLMRAALRELLPAEILQRPKKGFGIPVAKWFKGPLKQDLRDTLDPATLRTQGLFDPQLVQRLQDDLFSGRRNPYKPLWALYIFQQWYRTEFAV